MKLLQAFRNFIQRYPGGLCHIHTTVLSKHRDMYFLLYQVQDILCNSGIFIANDQGDLLIFPEIKGVERLTITGNLQGKQRKFFD